MPHTWGEEQTFKCLSYYIYAKLLLLSIDLLEYERTVRIKARSKVNQRGERSGFKIMNITTPQQTQVYEIISRAEECLGAYKIHAST